jgi:hypothetical protein
MIRFIAIASSLFARAMPEFENRGEPILYPDVFEWTPVQRQF